MNENFESSDEEENLKNENEFLKMKLMLEQGAQFGTMQTDPGLPAGAENQFLNYIMEYEKQAAEKKMIKVFDKIERPNHFKPVNEIPDHEIENAWNNLDEYLQKYGIDLTVCSPNISDRELYRFTTEELFDHEMNDMNVPGMMSCFTYDEFYPDHKYDNTRHAVEDCIGVILKKEHFDWMPVLKKENLRINDHYPVSEKEYINLINRFKEAYEDIQLQEMNDPVCTIQGNSCYVKGNYDVNLTLSSEEIFIHGDWRVEYEFDEALGFWEIVNVQIEGINF
jgi:hypothetical protein